MLRGETTVYRDICIKMLMGGKLLATGLDDGSVYLWDFQDGRRIRQAILASLPQGPISCLSWIGEDPESPQVDPTTVYTQENLSSYK
jgi:WD40 repeat protein